MGLSNYAMKFLRAAQILRQTEDHGFVPTYFVACQAIELALKGFLRGSGATTEHLKKKIGHNLCLAVVEAENKGLNQIIQLSDHDKAVIEMIGAYYMSKDLQYALSGFNQFPHIDLVLQVADNLATKTRDFCVERRTFHEGKPSAIR